MAISAEAYEYLREIEMIPGWTNIPDDDLRIIKLRVLFNGTITPKKHTTSNTGRFKGRPIRATKDGVSIVFEDVTQCAEVLGLNKATIHSALRDDHVSHVTSGYFLERLDTVNSTN